MPEPGIVLDHDQADDLRELLTLTAIVQEWLEYADDGILDDLARFAYRQAFHPRSYVHWLTEDLAGISGRLRNAVSGHQTATTSHNQDRVPPRQSHRRRSPQDQRLRPEKALTHQLP